MGSNTQVVLQKYFQLSWKEEGVYYFTSHSIVNGYSFWLEGTVCYIKIFKKFNFDMRCSVLEISAKKIFAFSLLSWSHCRVFGMPKALKPLIYKNTKTNDHYYYFNKSCPGPSWQFTDVVSIFSVLSWLTRWRSSSRDAAVDHKQLQPAGTYYLITQVTSDWPQ